ARGRGLSLGSRARVPEAVERPHRTSLVGRKDEREVPVDVVGAPLGLEVDLVLVGLYALRRRAALHLLDLAADADLLPLLGHHLGNLRERKETQVRGQGQAQPALAIGPQAVPFTVLLAEPELVEHLVCLLDVIARMQGLVLRAGIIERTLAGCGRAGLAETEQEGLVDLGAVAAVGQ